MDPATDNAVRYYDRYAHSIVEEAIYGDRWLRWTYGSPLGRAASWMALRRVWFSVLVGVWMNTPFSARRIPAFIRSYGIDMTQFVTPKKGWHNFNEFFTRPLTPGARTTDPDPCRVILPADGRHLAYPDGSDLSHLVVKGRPFTLAELLGDEALAQRFKGGSLLISRLCPTDYHRFHFPVAGTPGRTRRLPGPLDSVSPVALKAGARSLCANKRELTLLDSPQAGLMALVDVGAACVGRIVQTFTHGQPVGKGAEKGFFLFGGSTVITLFEPNRIEFDADLLEHSAQGIETYARMGDSMGLLLAK